MHELNEQLITETVTVTIASDVVALFPSLDTKETVRVCAEMLQNSNIECNNIDYNDMLLCIKLNLPKCSGVALLMGFLPQRKYEMGDENASKNLYKNTITDLSLIHI